MTAYIVRRLIAIIPVMLIVATLVFLLLRLVPGDPAAVMLGPDATPEAIQRLRTQLGLDRSLLVQFVTWMGQLVRADLGQSIFFQQPVTAVIADHLTPTVLLSLLALFIAVGIGVPAGIISAV